MRAEAHTGSRSSREHSRLEAWWTPQADRSARWLVPALLVGAAVLLRLLASDQWFQIDEWGFLADRELGRADDLLRPFNQHWSTLPIIAYRALWRLVGLRLYWPYQLLAILSHLCVAFLLYRVMRRSTVHPWLALAAMALFLLYGSGRDNIVNGFQIGFTGAIAAGLASALLLDHEGGVDPRRDGAGMAFGLASLMCSGIGIPMVLTVAVAVTLRRGLRTALLLVGPVIAAYLVWYAGFGGATSVGDPTVGEILRYARDLALAPFGDLTQVPGGGWLLAAVAVTGLVLVATSAAPSTLIRRHALPIALLGGLVALALSVAQGRAGIPGGPPAGSERYTYVAAAMLLPALALGLSELGRRARPLIVLGLALLLVGLPGNVDAFTQDPVFVLGGERLVLSVARVAGESQVDGDLQPLSIDAPYITVGWLRDGRRSGHIPDPPPTTGPAVERRARLLMSLFSVPDDPELGTGCEEVPTDQPVTVERGGHLLISNPTVTVEQLGPDGVLASALFYRRVGDDQLALRVADGPLVLALGADDARVSRCS